MSDVNGYLAGAAAWVDLMSPEPEKARKFYNSIFGWDYEVSGPETGFYAMAKLRGRNVAGIGGMPPGVQMPSTWNLYFDTKDLDGAIARIGKFGGKVAMGPMDIPGAGRMAMAADPTGAFFGLWEPSGHKGAGVQNEPGSMCWRELATRDVPAAMKFYAALFDYSVEKMPGGPMEYHLFKLGKETAAGLMAVPSNLPASVPPHWMNYFAVGDTDATTKKIEAEGGKVIHPAMDTPYGRMAVVADPWGAVFCVIKTAMPG